MSRTLELCRLYRVVIIYVAGNRKLKKDTDIFRSILRSGGSVWCAPVDKNHLIRTRRNMKQKKVKNNKKIICIKKVRPIDIVVNLEIELC